MSALAGLTLWAVLGATPPPSPTIDVRPALRGERFPWYDAKSDRVKPLLPWPDLEGSRLWSFGDWLAKRIESIGRFFGRFNRWRIPGIGGAGDLIAIGLAMLLLTVVLVVLLELLRRYRPLPGNEAAGATAIRSGSAQRIEGLPVGSGIDLTDPWGEAQRRRARGDYSGAVVYLFAHQLMTLDRLKQLRVVPGRTARQLVRAVGDRQFRGWVEPTLRLFEAVYYGHREPSAEAFESVWSLAQAFEQRAAAEAAS